MIHLRSFVLSIGGCQKHTTGVTLTITLIENKNKQQRQLANYLVFYVIGSLVLLVVLYI
jgi:hypothetical protein